jgi:cytidylate kinase
VNPRVLAIDGPAGAGKSTTARAVAEQLGFAYVNTGSMYRALALKALRTGTEIGSEAALLDLLEHMDIRLDAEARLFLDGVDETEAVRSAEVSRNSSGVAAHRGVRERLVAVQQRLADTAGSVVMEGRDIGTVVWPDSPIKIFLDADAGERARRRIRQQKLLATREELERVKAAILARDAQDAGRAEGPLKPAEDAVIIDTTGLTFDRQLERVMGAVRARWPKSWGPFPEHL